MILITPSLLPKEACDELIKIHLKNKDKLYDYNDTKIIDLQDLGSDDYVASLKYSKFIERFLSQHFTTNFIELAQIVKWSTKCSMGTHKDDSRRSTSLVSVTNLNDDFEGGSHFIDDPNQKEKIDILPKTGKTIAFDGMKYSHGVREVTKGTRYTLAIWYTTDIATSITNYL